MLITPTIVPLKETFSRAHPLRHIPSSTKGPLEISRMMRSFALIQSTACQQTRPCETRTLHHGTSIPAAGPSRAEPLSAHPRGSSTPTETITS